MDLKGKFFKYSSSKLLVAQAKIDRIKNVVTLCHYPITGTYPKTDESSEHHHALWVG